MTKQVSCWLAERTIVNIQFYQMEGRNLSLPLNNYLLNAANTRKSSYRGQPLKKSYPLPVLTLLSKNDPIKKVNPAQNQAQSEKARKFNLRKALEEYSSEVKKKQASSKQFNTRILIKQRASIKKKKRNNSEPTNPLVLKLPMKSDLLRGLKQIQAHQSFLPHQQRSPCSIPKIYRTIRFIKKPKIAIASEHESSRYLRWDTFCTPITYSKRILSKSQRKLPRHSSLNSMSLKAESGKQALEEPRNELRGWEQQPKRYLTVYNSVIEGDYDQF